MEFFGTIAFLSLIISALLYALGAAQDATRMLLFSVVLALVAPILVALLHNLRITSGAGIGVLVAGGLITIAIASVRFTLRKRRIESFFGSAKTSLKKRVDRE